MTENGKHIQHLFASELQFRLASAVYVATMLNEQPIDLPIEWVHGQHRVKYEEIALREDQAVYAAKILHRSATFLMAVAIKDAIKAVEPDPYNSTDPNVQAAYQIARLIRNAFAHAPFSPTWSIDRDCRNKVFSIPNVISLDTTGLQGTVLDWRHYGGPLALLQLCRFVRFQILKDPNTSRKIVPIPKNEILQMGELVMKKVDKLPPDARPVEVKRLPDGSIDLGGGYILRSKSKDEE